MSDSYEDRGWESCLQGLPLWGLHKEPERMTEFWDWAWRIGLCFVVLFALWFFALWWVL